MKKMLLLFLIALAFSFNFLQAASNAAENYRITEREAAKIAYCDYIKVHGQIMIPELGMRVTDVKRSTDEYLVTLSIYEKITNKVLHECATYTISVKDGRIRNVKLIDASPSTSDVSTAAAGIEAGDYSNADAIAAKMNGTTSQSAVYRMIFKQIKEVSMAKIMNGGADPEKFSKYFDSRL